MNAERRGFVIVIVVLALSAGLGACMARLSALHPAILTTIKLPCSTLPRF